MFGRRSPGGEIAAKNGDLIVGSPFLTMFLSDSIEFLFSTCSVFVQATTRVQMMDSVTFKGVGINAVSGVPFIDIKSTIRGDQRSSRIETD